MNDIGAKQITIKQVEEMINTALKNTPTFAATVTNSQKSTFQVTVVFATPLVCYAVSLLVQDPRGAKRPSRKRKTNSIGTAT